MWLELRKVPAGWALSVSERVKTRPVIENVKTRPPYCPGHFDKRHIDDEQPILPAKSTTARDATT